MHHKYVDDVSLFFCLFLVLLLFFSFPLALALALALALLLAWASFTFLFIEECVHAIPTSSPKSCLFHRILF